MAAKNVTSPVDRGMVAALVASYGGIRGAQRAMADQGVKVSRGFLDGQLRGQAKGISEASANKVNAFLGKLAPQERRDIRDERRRIISDTANDPKRIAAEAKRAAKRDQEARKAERSKFRADLRKEQRKAKPPGGKQLRTDDILSDSGGTGGGGGGLPGDPGDTDIEMLDAYDEYLMELEGEPDFYESDWQEPDELPF